MTAIVGLAILVTGDIQGQSSYLGYGFSFLSGLAYGTYVYLTRGFEIEIHSALITVVTFSISGIILFPSIILFPPVWIDSHSIVLLVYLGLATTGISFFLFVLGLRECLLLRQ